MKIRKENIFIIDGLGAVLSTLCLVLLIRFEEFFGMPKSNLYVFVAIGSLFSIYSISCYLLNLSNWRKYLQLIAVLNIAYCLLTVFSIFRNLNNLTKYGCIYFVAELLVIITLVVYELRIANSK
jgi:hypothetical protein